VSLNCQSELLAHSSADCLLPDADDSVISEVMLKSCIVVTCLLQLLLGTVDEASVLSNQTQRDSDVLGSYRLPSSSDFTGERPMRLVNTTFLNIGLDYTVLHILITNLWILMIISQFSFEHFYTFSQHETV